MHDTPKPPVTLILGGARSGKSHHAQKLAALSDRVLFIATATAVDPEMSEKITRHRQDRQRDRLDWTVLEEPLALAEAIHTHGPAHDVILIDCLTLYTANLLTIPPAAVTENVALFLETLQAPPRPIILVSNEVGSGVVPSYASGRQYRDLLGELNQRVAAIATGVLLMVAGLPLTIKARQQ
ncbi:bifunctional adenosylcobinamide kinase/adenosylcobinamide-phosphate guanylyltransferase [Granulicella tundricola]|uniref:Adenosylcobinamide kinase n=1 Tax=Granulicella tundricola (strain ATCC BAA-1859 / DSM 23138 / MP5ACTX9) TaxID=1198114 RepID=E8X1C6_GRATM|nr:bifunctional adenosylcobinamide kinase/adenosylcobinamide-phosphate guanylyltransferase [Granulicella tundricola]ADW69080.1 Adenosylcobinamide-phosphate guanylyltransferase [Granulicella tundricola MP5ACTX9]